MTKLMLLLFPFLLTLGQILFKKAALARAGQGLVDLLVSPWMVAALSFYCVATGVWVWLLQSVPLSTAYPFAALGFVLVPVASVFLFGETISITYCIGCLLIVAGVVLTQG